MTIGFVGLGKLGLPCALATEAYGGHQVLGAELSTEILRNLANRHIPYMEAGAQELMDHTSLKVCSPEDLIERCDIIFFAIQTPHEERFEGVTSLPDDRSDFDYCYLKSAISEYADIAAATSKNSTFVVISTVLPGTIEREIQPLLNGYVALAYNPFFIAMGTAIQDFVDPEFVLLGCDEDEALARIKAFYATLHDQPVFETAIVTAELIKVAYNTFIGMKIVFANTMMEICEATGADVDDLTRGLSLGTRRLLSPRYLSAGMGDGGGCHPRDNIAMSYLARKHELSFDLFEAIMTAREKQTGWIADLACQAANESGLPIVVLGTAFKAGTNITTGSPARLLLHLLEQSGVAAMSYDPYVAADNEVSLDSPAVFVVTTKHPEFTSVQFPWGSYVIDPWGVISPQRGVKLRRLGRVDDTP